VGGALGLAVLGTIAQSHTQSAISGGTASLTAVTDGFQLGFEIAAIVLVVAAVLAALTLRERSQRLAVVAPETTAEDAERAAA
jgi:hypothetical protein